MQVVFWIAGIALALFALDRLCLWAETKGWIYWRKVKRKGSAGAVIDIAAIIDPTARHAAEARQQPTQEDADDGDDDGKRKPDDRAS
jgi:hypothetical protein